jgi:hypothetical protein
VLNLISPKSLGLLKSLHEGADFSQIEKRTRTAFVRNGYTTRDGKLTPKALEAIAVPAVYVVQKQTKADGKLVWVNFGEWDTEAEAEEFARRTSVLNSGTFRVVGKGVVESTQFTVFNFGQRYTQDALTGERIATSTFASVPSEEFPTSMFIIQKRVSPAFAGEQKKWELAEDRRYATYDDAAQTAYAMVSAEDQGGWEYRVVYEDPPLQPTVYRNGQAGRPDTSIMDVLVTVTNQFFSADPGERAEAAGILLSEWAPDAEAVRIACAEALRRVELFDLAEAISHV